MNSFPVIKIIPNNASDLNHCVSALATDLILNQAIAYVAAGNGVGQPEYIGYAPPGTATSAALWLIKKLTYDSNNKVTLTQFANGKMSFDQIWDGHASLSYS